MCALPSVSVCVSHTGKVTLGNIIVGAGGQQESKTPEKKKDVKPKTGARYDQNRKKELENCEIFASGRENQRCGVCSVQLCILPTVRLKPATYCRYVLKNSTKKSRLQLKFKP